MSRNAIVAGTGFEGRAPIIRRHCRVGAPVYLVRELDNEHDENAVAVYIPVPRFFGLLGASKQKVGYIKSRAAKSIAEKMDSRVKVTAVVRSFYAPEGRDHPRVSLELDY